MKKYQKFLIVAILFTTVLYSTSYWSNKSKEEIIQSIEESSNKLLEQENKVETIVETIYIDRKDMDYEKYSHLQLNVESVAQLPELPTGCEVTSLTMVLNYLGHDVDKLVLADTYLPKGPIGETHPDVAFIGNPRDAYSYGANAPVLVKTANDYLKDVESDYTAYNLTGTEFTDLLSYVNDGYPVMVWETIGMFEGYPSTKWVIDNTEFQWYANFHCMVLIGYTDDCYILLDPLDEKGENETYFIDKELVEKRYNELHKQAIVIY